MARADTAAHMEARHNAHLRDTWEPEPSSYRELHEAYGRPHSTSRLGRLKDIAFDGDVTRKALAISRKHGHPWSRNGNRPEAPSLLDVLLPLVKDTGPGHPVFTVTAKDLAFCFYNLGILTLRQLQTNLEEITREEQRRFADRKMRRLKPIVIPPRPPPPRFPTPQADRLKRLQQASVVPQAIFMKRLEQLRAFEQRHDRRQQREHARAVGFGTRQVRRPASTCSRYNGADPPPGST